MRLFDPMEGANIASPHDPREQRSDKFHLWLDDPADWSLKVRRLRLSGWCVAKKNGPLVAIRARLAGRIFDGRFDRKRTEVGAFVGVSDAPDWCGFTVDVAVPFGHKRLELQVASADGRWHKAYARDVQGPLFVGHAERQLWARIDEADALWRYVVSFNRPTDWDKRVRKLYLAGWCVDRTGGWIHGVRAVIGNKVYSGRHGIARPDLAPAFPELLAASHGGFAIAATVPSGRAACALQVKTVDGIWHQLFSRDVTGLPAGAQDDEQLPLNEAAFFETPTPAPPRFQFWFDRPRSWRRPVRHLRIAGWCVAAWGEEVTELRARVRGRTFQAQYAVLRPDVAATFEGRGAALQSGFSIDVVLPFGVSQLALEARSSGGAWEPFFTTRVIGVLRASFANEGHDPAGSYLEWIRAYEKLSRSDKTRIRRHIASLSRRPKFSILLVASAPDKAWLHRAVESVRAQLYDNWELCMVDAASSDPARSRMVQACAGRDHRIKLKRGSGEGAIAAGLNDALVIATGEFVATLGAKDELAPTALYFAALELLANPDAKLLYSDEDKLDPQGLRCEPSFKPDWDPDLFASENYVAQLSFYEADLLRAVGGFRERYEHAHEYDLLLRCVSRITPAQIKHIPHVLYHRRPTSAAAEPVTHGAAVGALQEHLDLRGANARALLEGTSRLRIIHSPPADDPLVSIVIPTRDRASLLRRCVESIRAKTEYSRFEIIVVDNESRAPETLEFLAALVRDEHARIVRAPGEFNYSRLNNIGVANARGTFLALLNNDLEVINPGWLTEMISHAARPEIGAVGARLWYPDGRLQHGGVILGVGGVATHAFHGLSREDVSAGRASQTQNFSAVTAACLVMRREIYQRLGGLDEVNLAVAFNDVDFCLRMQTIGLRIVWTPQAELIHHESASRGLEDTLAKQRRFLSEVDYMRRKWGQLLEADPFYNLNLSIESNELFRLSFPPRTKKPWIEIAL